jgi:two-component system phosphate regulon sensor histidine kinase PhoR
VFTSLPAPIAGRDFVLAFFPQGVSPGCVLVARDVTEERRYDRLRKEFVANVSHELRTPLSVIAGYVETLKDGALKDEQNAPKFLESIERNVHRLASLVSDLLELSRLESSGQLAHPRRVETRPLLEKVVEDFRPLADRKGQRLTLEISPEVKAVDADPDLLERALRNLVDNAIKYTPDGGSITLGARTAADSLLFSVRDTGIGIPLEDLPRIFERFYRVDKSRSRELGGTGLGLAIVKHIAQLHGGAISVESRPGAGSVFTLRLPQRETATSVSRL